jgi:iron complex outermembrane receptor protein
VISDLGGEYKTDNYGASLTGEWDFSDQLSIKSISAWRFTEATQNDDLDHTGTPFLHRTTSVHPVFDDPRETDQYSQEFQFTGSAFDDRLQYVSGLYWFREKTDGGDQLSYLGPYEPAIANLFFLNSSNTLLDADNQAIAVFTQAEWEFDEHWRLTAGVRYTDEERKLTRVRQLIDPPTLDLNGGPVFDLGNGIYAVSRPGFAYNPAFGLQFQDYVQTQISDDDVTPMASIQYLIDDAGWVDTGSVYLTYSEGFLSGGLSEAPSGDLEEYEPEEVENWELGIKLDLFGRRLRVNAALFKNDYKNRQLTTVVISPETGNPAPDTINARSSSISGFELESTWLATERIMVMFNFTINDGDIDTYDDVQNLLATTPEVPDGCERRSIAGLVDVDSCPNDRSNENLPRLPEQTYLLAVQYDWDASFGTVIPRIQASLKKDIDYCFDSLSCDSGFWFEDEQFELSATVSWTSPDGRWAGSLYGTNLTDEDHLIGGSALVESSGAGGYPVAQPRMYGAELQYRF